MKNHKSTQRPTIYDTILDITGNEVADLENCCPQIYQPGENYLVIGKKIDPEEVGLERKVSGDEVLISVPKSIIDKWNK